MKYLMYSQSGEGAQVLRRIQQEGNEVGLYITEKPYQTVFDGLLPKVKKIDDFVDKDTLIIFDTSGDGKIADIYRKKGNLVYGASKIADQLETDREFGFDSMQLSKGICVPRFENFTDFRSGIDYIKSHKEKLVFKPSGKMPCKLTYVPHNNEELAVYMEFVEDKFGKFIDSFVLQDFVEGVLVSTECFISPNGIVGPYNHTVEAKKCCSGDMGPSTGCSGNITWVDENSWVAQQVFTRDLIQSLVDRGFVGQLDLNAIVTEDDKVYGLEWTPRFGYDATPTLLTLLDQDFGEFFYNICSGIEPEFVNNTYAGSIRITIPPYPAELKDGVDPEEFSPSRGVPIQNYERSDKDIYWYEVELQKDRLVHSGGTGVICMTLGMGYTPSSSLDRPYEIAEELHIPDKQYRDDLDQVLPQMVEDINGVLEYASY